MKFLGFIIGTPLTKLFGFQKHLINASKLATIAEHSSLDAEKELEPKLLTDLTSIEISDFSKEEKQKLKIQYQNKYDNQLIEKTQELFFNSVEYKIFLGGIIQTICLSFLGGLFLSMIIVFILMFKG